MVLNGSNNKVSFVDQIHDLESREGRDRDPEELNRKTKISWSSVIGEPPNLRSPDWLWKFSSRCFTLTQTWIYKALTVLFALPFTLILAIQFALLGFVQIWMVHPCIKFVQVICVSLRSLLEIVTSTIVGPICETLGLCLSRVKVRHQRIVSSRDEPAFPFVI